MNSTTLSTKFVISAIVPVQLVMGQISPNASLVYKVLTIKTEPALNKLQLKFKIAALVLILI